MKSLAKTVKDFLRTTAGRHPASPGVNATAQMPHPKPPADRPHIREDAMKEVNLHRELGKSQEPKKVLMFFYAQRKSGFQPPASATGAQKDMINGKLLADAKDAYLIDHGGENGLVTGETMHVNESELPQIDKEESAAGYKRVLVGTMHGPAYAYLFTRQPPADAKPAECWPPLNKSEPLEKVKVFESNQQEPYRHVWRVQNEAGIGPYTGRDQNWTDVPHDEKSGRPEPMIDPGFTTQDHREKKPQHKYGFETEEQLHSWFTPNELHRLARQGFKPTQVKASHIWSSGKQAFFLPHQEELGKSTPTWSLKIRGRDGSHKAIAMRSLGPTKGSAYQLESGELVPADMCEGVVMFDGTQDRKGPNSNTADIGFHLAKTAAWRVPTDEELGKEHEWEYRHVKNALGDVFPTKEHFIAAAKQGKIVDMPEGVDNASDLEHVDEVRHMVSKFQHPRDVDRILQGFQSGSPIPTPIVIRHPGGHFLMSGNTRQNLAHASGFKPKVLLVDAPGMQKTEELDKGAARKRAPYGPLAGETEETKHAKGWISSNRPKVREELPRHEGEVRFRGIHKLAAATQHRRNPQTGDLEFLLHRGMNHEEAGLHQGHGTNMRTSWTPNIHEARDFSKDYGNEEEGGEVMSAWIPAKQMHNFPYMESHDPAVREFRNEFEVVVAPHDISKNIHKLQAWSDIPSKATVRATQLKGDLKSVKNIAGTHGVKKRIKQQLAPKHPFIKSMASVLEKVAMKADLGEMIHEHEHLVHVLKTPSHTDDMQEAKKQAGELAEYKEKFKEGLKKAKPIEVSSVAVVDPETHSILMGRRSDTGRWTMPGGHANPGESPLVTAMRELREESGIVTHKLKYLGTERKMCEDGIERIIHAYVVYGRPKTTGKHDPDEEVQQWHWIPFSDRLPTEIEQNLHSPKNVTLKYLGLQQW